MAYVLAGAWNGSALRMLSLSGWPKDWLRISKQLSFPQRQLKGIGGGVIGVFDLMPQIGSNQFAADGSDRRYENAGPEQ